jgi:hypothetical protein
MAEEHCHHHTCDTEERDDCAAGDCYDEDECVHCDCCCTCLGCEYGPKDGMLLFPAGGAA